MSTENQHVEVPQEAVEALALELAGETGERSIVDGAGMYETNKLARARRLLRAPALFIIAQERERLREAIEFIQRVASQRNAICKLDHHAATCSGAVGLAEGAAQLLSGMRVEPMFPRRKWRKPCWLCGNGDYVLGQVWIDGAHAECREAVAGTTVAPHLAALDQDPDSKQEESSAVQATCFGAPEKWGPWAPHPLGSKAGPYEKGQKPCERCVNHVKSLSSRQGAKTPSTEGKP